MPSGKINSFLFVKKNEAKPSLRCTWCHGTGEVRIPAYQYKTKSGRIVKKKDWVGICECVKEEDDNSGIGDEER